MHSVQTYVRWVPLVSVFFSLVVSPAIEANGAKPVELKIIAQRHFISQNDKAPPICFTKVAEKPLVIRNAEELAAISWKGQEAKDKAKAQKDPVLQKEVQDLLTKALKIEKIDWEKQMVLVVSDKLAYRVPSKWEFAPLNVNGDTLTVIVNGTEKKDYVGSGSPWAVALVERFNGKVEFKGFPAK